ncbi:hypothetical protein GJU43_19005 [Flavobacterium sp. LC2016-23]|uniref:hypothetical protein n=1 Tax=Flavobacterium sp. LC2016-23 TaxID=2666330 RepID=UPI0012B032E8|nr:hypothetical protein [Flavobacterium sp. LC2016-23]MRX41380.1 hypothetical protein [Flavobacterium sp. LC2016-23]
MNIFPIQYYEIELLNDSSKALSELEKNTMITDSLTSEWTKKAFIGQVSENGFKIISSESGRGAFCVLSGKLESKKGSVEIRINKAFRVMLSIVFLFPIVGFIVSFFIHETEVSISLIIPTLMSVVVFRFILTEIAFRIISRNGLKKLTEIIGITKLKISKAQNT